MSEKKPFTDRFAELIAEGRSRKAELVDEALQHLAKVDEVVKQMRREGLAVRCELGMGAHVMPSDMRFIVRMEANL